ncbi:MAG: hypothetical protein LBB38_03045 [Puniceicoccales bacterium]|jgi:hypothetical protein|nr:hypothetical protein [Puniceicoccales bacterium]
MDTSSLGVSCDDKNCTYVTDSTTNTKYYVNSAVVTAVKSHSLSGTFTIANLVDFAKTQPDLAKILDSGDRNGILHVVFRLANYAPYASADSDDEPLLAQLLPEEEEEEERE